MNNKFEYLYQVRLSLDPLRAACLRYAKTFSKVEYFLQNKVFFQFDSEGVLLKALDKNSLSLAQKQFMQLSKVNQIEILTYNIDEEEYKQIIQKEIKNSNKYSKCFMQLITYEAFKGISLQLKNFGYEEPMKIYEKYMKSHPKFSFLLCNEQQFQIVKQDLLKLFNKQNLSSLNTSSNQVSSSTQLSTQILPILQQSQQTNSTLNSSILKTQSTNRCILNCGNQGNIIQKAKSENTQPQNNNKGIAFKNVIQQNNIVNRQIDQKQSKCDKMTCKSATEYNLQCNNTQGFTVQYIKKDNNNKSESEIFKTSQCKAGNQLYDSCDSQCHDTCSCCDEIQSNGSQRQRNSYHIQQYNNHKSNRSCSHSNDNYTKNRYENNKRGKIQLHDEKQYLNQKQQFVKKDLQSSSKECTDTTATGSHHELDGFSRKQQKYYYNDQYEDSEINYDEQNDSDKLDHKDIEGREEYYSQEEIFGNRYNNHRSNNHLKRKNQYSSNSSGVPSRTPSLSCSQQSFLSVQSSESQESYKEFIYPSEELDIQKYQLMSCEEKNRNFYNLFKQYNQLQQQDNDQICYDNSQILKPIDYVNSTPVTSSSSSSSSPGYACQSQILALISPTIINALEKNQSSLKSRNQNIKSFVQTNNSNQKYVINSSSCIDVDGTISNLPEIIELTSQGHQVVLVDPGVYIWLYSTCKIKQEKEKKIKIIHESKKVVAIEGLDQEIIKIAQNIAIENLQRVTTNQTDILRQNERFIEIKNEFEKEFILEDQLKIQQVQNCNLDEEQEEIKKNNIKAKTKNKNQSVPNQILEIISFDQFKEQIKKFKQKQIIKMCNDSFRQINPKDKQKGCILLMSVQQQTQNNNKCNQILINSQIKEVACKLESIYCSILKSQLQKILYDQSRPYYQYRQFDVKEVRRICPLNEAETAFISEYKYQTYCLKQYLKLNDKKLNKIIANYLEQSIADNPQLNQIYGISVIGKGQDQKEKELYVLSELKYMNLKNALDEKVFKNENVQLDICIQLVNAVKNLHSKNVDEFKLFHGNLKPANVLFDENLSLYLSDINLDPIGCSNISSSSRLSQGTSLPSSVTPQSLNEMMMGVQSGSVNNLANNMANNFNNPNQNSNMTSNNLNFYCAPELFKGDSKNCRPTLYSDIWSLGLLLYEILSGQSLKIDNKKKIKKLQYDQFSKTFIGLKNIIQRCLLKESQQRPSCEEILIEIQEVQKNLNN